MTKTRTTISISADLLKKTKIKAVENNLNLSSFIEKLLQLNLDHQWLMHKVEEETKAKRALIKKLSGQFNLGDMHPREIKKLILNRYDEDSLS